MTVSSRKTLMIPGPSEPDVEILNALSRPVYPHYGPDWSEIYRDTCEEAKKLFQTGGDVIILNCSGSAGVEMGIVNLAEPGEKVLNIRNGFFSEISEDVITKCGMTAINLDVEWGDAANPNVVADTLKKSKDIKMMYCVHNDTMTGAVNPVRELGKVATEFNIPFAVDFVSSYGGMELDVDNSHVDISVGYSSKALGAINGAVPIAIQPRVWEMIKKRRKPFPGRFLNLATWRSAIDDWGSWGHPFPSGQPTSVIVAMREAIKIALREGLQNRYRRHRICREATHAAVKAMGLEVFTREEVASDTVSVIKVREGTDKRILSTMSSKHGVIIGGGVSKVAGKPVSKGIAKVAGKVIRIGHMGNTAQPKYVLPALAALELTLQEIGEDLKPGSGVAAATEVFRKL